MSPQRTRSSNPDNERGQAPSQDGEDSGHHNGSGGDATDRGPAPRQPLRDVLVEARGQLQDLLGRPTEAVTSVEREDGGWVVQVEVVELERIPASTSILGVYDLHIDTDGNVLEYSRSGRYHRNQADEGES